MPWSELSEGAPAVVPFTHFHVASSVGEWGWLVGCGPGLKDTAWPLVTDGFDWLFSRDLSGNAIMSLQSNAFSQMKKLQQL